MRARSRGEFPVLSSQVPEASDRQNIALPDIDKSPDVAAADFVLNGVYKTETTDSINDANTKKKQFEKDRMVIGIVPIRLAAGSLVNPLN